MHLYPKTLLPAGLSLLSLATAPEGLAEAVCPPDESVRPPFPGKFANTAVPELGNRWEQGSQGFTKQGREEGAGRGRGFPD